MNTNLSQSILERISEKNIQPKNRWRFMLERVLLWVPGIFTLMIGALATSAMIYVLSHTDWKYTPFITDDSFWKFALTTLPYLWIVFVCIFVLFTYKAVRKTQGGYRYRTRSLILGNILMSIVLGSAGYALGIGQVIDTGLGNKVSGFDSLVQQRMEQWSDPQQGRLVGEVRNIDDTALRIKDIDGYFWIVDTRALVQREESLRNTILDQHRQVRMLGYLDEDFPNTFHACLMLPLYPPRLGDGIQPPTLSSDQTMQDPSCREVLRLNPPLKEISR